MNRRTAATSRSSARAVDAQLVQLLVEHVLRDAVEEQVDGEDHDDEVVEPADDRHVVRDRGRGRRRGSRARPRASPCAPAGVRSSRMQLEEQPAVDRRAAASGRNAAQPAAERIRSRSLNGDTQRAIGAAESYRPSQAVRHARDSGSVARPTPA